MSRPAPREGYFVLLTLHPHEHPPVRGRLFLAPLLFCMAITAFPGSLATESAAVRPGTQATITVTTNLVLLPVKVTDSRGLFASGLRREDFKVFEDGQAQELTVFEEEDTPVTVGLVVDHSRSMGSKLADVVAAMSSFAHSSNPQDEMFVVNFNDDVWIKLLNGKSFSSDAQELEEGLTAVSARGRTALYDAVSEGLRHLRYGRSGKMALIIVSDGGDNASHLKYSEVLKQARQSQAVIYSIGLLGSDSADENPGLLRRLCRDTGGVAYFPRQGESVRSISKEIARDLREQYTLGYAPKVQKGPETFRKTEVKVAAPGRGRLNVRSRQGYSSAPGAPRMQPAGPAAR